MTRHQSTEVRYQPRGDLNGSDPTPGLDQTAEGNIQETTSAGSEHLQAGQTNIPGDSPIIRVVIVDDDASTRRFLKEVLQQCQQFEVVGEAGDGVAAINLVTGLQPDLVVLDLSMPRLDGYGTIEGLRYVAPDVMVIVLSGLRSEAADAAAREGVTAFLPKGIPPLELLDRLGAILGRTLTLDASSSQRVPAFQNGHSSRGPVSPEAARCRAVVCDDDPVVRHTITQLLEHHDVVVTAETETSPTLLALVDLAQPDLVVLDLWLKGAVDGALIRDMSDRSPRSTIVVYSELAEWKARAVSAGARAFVLKPDFDELAKQLNRISISLAG
jgi:DNA-binding NarL/FixJ family response regulator